MAHYDAHGLRNRGYDGYGKKEPPYRAAVVGYSAVSESYVASTEQVVKLSGYPYSNPATYGQVWPLSSSRAQFKKDDDYDYDLDYSPKFSHVTNSRKDSPRRTSYKANSPPQGQYSNMYSTTHDSPLNSPRKNLHGLVQPLSTTRIKTKKDDDYDYSPKFSLVPNSPHDSPRKTSYRANSPPKGHYSDMINTNHNSPLNSPRKNFHDQVRPLSLTRIQPKKDDDYDYSPKLSLVSNPAHDSPRKAFQRAASPPPGHYSSMFDTNMHSSHDLPRNNIRGNRGNFNSVDNDDVECRDGVCHSKSKHVQDYNRENPRKDSYHQTSDPRQYYNTDKLPEANNVYDSLSYSASHERNRNNPHDAVQWVPPIKEHQGVIDSAEKQRRHGTLPPPVADHKYKKTIDSDTLAKMYGGVYVK